MAHDRFLDDRARERFSTSMGEVELPVLYRDTSVLLAFFRVDPDRAGEVLAATPFSPARLGRGTAIAVLAAYDHRETSIGPYREVGSALAVVPRGIAAPALPLMHLFRETAYHDVGWHLLDLPVTTTTADVGGRELYGFPKFTTEIDVDVSEGGVHVAVRPPTGREPIVTVEGRPGPGLIVRPFDLVLYTVRDGQVLRATVEARGRMRTGFGRGLALHVGSADHPMAHRLTALGLDGARPAFAQVCRRFRGVLNAGVPFHVTAARAA